MQGKPVIRLFTPDEWPLYKAVRLKALQSAGYVSMIDRGMAIEPRAIRRYLDRTLQNVSAFGSTPQE